MKPIILGLTGSIAMGKSTIGAMLENTGIPVHDADQCVHRLLEPDSPARPDIAAAFPYFEFPDLYKRKTYSMDRAKLGRLVFERNELRERLEDILHPLVRQDQQGFIAQQTMFGRSIVCLDIPLLFETRADKHIDYTLVVSAPLATQRQRALERENIDETILEAILARQMPDREKCKRADYVIKTGLGHSHSMKLLKEALLDIRIKSGLAHDPEDEKEEEEVQKVEWA
ncbi:MAG: dephospho-CoA kinase [Alphaproteobacteria bacterium]|nr:dephospho-CoA kinase [Alphaproteobacteria bacterium]